MDYTVNVSHPLPASLHETTLLVVERETSPLNPLVS
jgi:hypothetical protein